MGHDWYRVGNYKNFHAICEHSKVSAEVQDSRDCSSRLNILSGLESIVELLPRRVTTKTDRDTALSEFCWFSFYKESFSDNARRLPLEYLAFLPSGRSA